MVLAVQVVLMEAGNEVSLTIQSDLRVIQQNAITGAICYRTVFDVC